MYDDRFFGYVADTRVICTEYDLFFGYVSKTFSQRNISYKIYQEDVNLFVILWNWINFQVDQVKQIFPSVGSGPEA